MTAIAEAPRGNLDRLWKAWHYADSLRRRFEGRPLGDPIRQEWIFNAAQALEALKTEESRLLDPAAKL